MKSPRLVWNGMLLAVLSGFAVTASAQAVERLWSQRKAPFPIPVPSGLDTNFSMTDTTKNPYVSLYPATTDNTGAAVVICPGGGYEHLSPIREGRNVAIKFRDYGVSAFVLRYRYGVVSGNGPYQHPIEMWDAQRAVRWVRANAARFGIDPKRVGMIGFSAGGHLASTVATHYDAGNPDNTSINYYPGPKDSVDGFSCKPDFQILLYPVINMDSSIAHAGSRTALLGTNPSLALRTLLSNERQVTAATPPAFISATLNDGTVPYVNSQRYADSLQKKGVSRMLLPYPSGTHGYGLADGQDGAANYADVKLWPDSARAWMQRSGFLTPTTGLISRKHRISITPIGAFGDPQILDLQGRRLSIRPREMFFNIIVKPQ